MPLRICVEGSSTLPLLPICARPPSPPIAAAAPKASKIAVIDLGGKARRAQWIKADVLVEIEREAVRANGAMEGDKHLPLLGVAHALHRADQSRTLRHKELLVIVRVVVGRQHDQDRPAESAVDMVGDDAFEDRSLEDPV